MRSIFLLLLINPFLSFSNIQNDSAYQGVRWRENITWDSVLRLAKSENKYIFFDCYASWCMPCKVMDAKVYNDDEVGNVFNRNFISIKVQIDNIDSANLNLKEVASFIKKSIKEYNISQFPTYLFFSPNGEIVHKDIGYKSVNEMTQLGRNISDVKNQFYTFKRINKDGIKDKSKLSQFSLFAKRIGDYNYAEELAREYFKEILDKQGVEFIVSKEPLLMLYNFSYLLTSKNNSFTVIYKNQKLIDREILKIDSTRQGFSRYTLSTIIKREIVNPLIENGISSAKEPNWRHVFSRVREKYDEAIAEEITSVSKVEYYRKVRNWIDYARAFNEKLKFYPPQKNGFRLGALGDTWALNTVAWDVFLNCNIESVLEQAYKWSLLSIRICNDCDVRVQYFDTKANLLYKLGRKEEAIRCEEVALEFDQYLAKKNGLKIGSFYDEYNSNLEKMKRGEPTWPVQ